MIILAPFDPAWSKQFADEKIRLENALSCLCKIEHIGSTAIPGIAAKPVIDILISISNLSQHKADLIPKVETLGYQYNPAFEAEFPHRCYFFKNNEAGQRTHQIHMVNDPSAWWAKHNGFGPFVWFEKGTHHFVAEGGLNHTAVEGKLVIELTYSLAKD